MIAAMLALSACSCWSAHRPRQPRPRRLLRARRLHRLSHLARRRGRSRSGMTLPAAMLVAGLAALVVGALSLRTKGFFFLMVTLAFGQMIFFVFHDTKLGGGTDGAYLAKPLISAFGLDVRSAEPAAQPAPAGRLLRRAGPAGRRSISCSRSCCARCSAACSKASASTSTACRRWASTPRATSSPPSSSPACWRARPATCGPCTRGFVNPSWSAGTSRPKRC